MWRPELSERGNDGDGSPERVHGRISPTPRSIVQQFDSRELVESLIQINPRRARDIGYGGRGPRELAS
jgi:hypothetical protein